MKVQDVTNLSTMFGGEVTKLLPVYSEIPDEFGLYSRNKWVEVTSDWFFKGIRNYKWTPKEDIDQTKALRHIQACLASFEIQHEHKIRGCAYLLSQWFDDVKYEAKE
ncbi:hypothetical protein [Brevibacillus sp. NRS-1366]|uniref:hypothetical protein n=1 Tax=Brevibacillus sp. NRS-1366 TaxID=3233899 RepID=UPI003D222CB6